MSSFETKTISADGTRWRVAMNGRAGPVLLLVHGFPLDHTMWRHQLAGLSDVAQIIAPDLPGYGKSESGSRPFSMENAADGLVRMLDALKVESPVIYCGLSMGGYIGWQFWQRHRERLAGLICCDTRAAADPTEVGRGREMMAARVRKEGNDFVAPAMIPKLFAADAVAAGSEAVNETSSVISATSAETIAQGQLAMAARVDATEWLPEIECPMLLVVGAEDAITTPTEMCGMADRITGANYCELASAGHMAPLEQPDAFNQHVREFIANRI